MIEMRTFMIEIYFCKVDIASNEGWASSLQHTVRETIFFRYKQLERLKICLIRQLGKLEIFICGQLRNL